MKLKKGMYNLLCGVGTQVITLAMGIIVPRLILLGYGSEVNGLLNAVTQIYGYVALLEAGVGITTIQALYKPIAEKNKRAISEVYVAAEKYYHRISFYYFICVVVLSFVGPFAIKSELNKLDIAVVILLHGLSGVINFYFAATFKQLLIAEGKNYVSNIIVFAVQMLTYISKIVLALIQANIVFIQISYFVITVFQVVVYRTYFKKKYDWLDTNAIANESALKQKNSFMIHQLVNTVFNSTDMIVLSTICGLASTSIYAVYNLVFSGLFNILNTLFTSLGFTLGQTYHEDKRRYIELHDSFESVYIALVFALISVCYLLILPFISLYTAGVNDIAYYDTKLPFLFCMIQLLSAIRAVASNLINIAQHAKQTIKRAIIEAIINLSISIIAASVIGIYGVLLGTIVALLYRANDIIIYSNIKILKRSPKRAYMTVGLNFALFFCVVIIEKIVNIKIQRYIDFIAYGVILTPLMLLMYVGTNMLINKMCVSYLKMICSKLLRPLAKKA